MTAQTPVLDVAGLAVDYGSGRRRSHAVTGVSFSVARGRTLGLVGESGSGKTTIGMAVLGLVPVVAGEIRFFGRPVHDLSARRRRELGKVRQVIFQDPYSSLDPLRTIGYSLTEPARFHGMSASAALERARELVRKVGLDESALSRFPAQFSGGQRQRIAIARALMTEPEFIVCDEPVSALDLSVQADVMNLLTSLQKEFGLSLLFISHDLTIVRQISDDIIVLRAGEIVEAGPTEQLFADPRDPYTRALLASVPKAARETARTDAITQKEVG
ncbi:Oligopeptide transport ATP-binding protein OppF [Microbacterium oxydans]|uniref:ATP-binding cassette domain-containing protein n=1 Tax=Microbacterium oxydans TaxID=82380 RepID=UPI001D892806|nr:ATP-binding cassette domain-containing protein [Microbacterium oxydans]CAH0175473.1 Oligopeptide transport ATP-binding protein OppF [Microbacterium oxydans]